MGHAFLDLKSYLGTGMVIFKNMTNVAYLVAFCRRYRLERPHRLRGFKRDGVVEFDGDYDECDDPKRQWAKTLVRHTIVDVLARFLKDCGMVDVNL